MARRYRQPLALAVAEGATLWGLAIFSLVAPIILAHSRPNLQLALWVALGAVVVFGSWWWYWRSLRDQIALGKTLDDLRALSPAGFERWVGARFQERATA